MKRRSAIPICCKPLIINYYQMEVSRRRLICGLKTRSLGGPRVGEECQGVNDRPQRVGSKSNSEAVNSVEPPSISL